MDNTSTAMGNDELSAITFRRIPDITERPSSVDEIHRIENFSGILEEARKVNPGYSPSNPDTSQNCGFCSFAYDLRMKGYDVYAGEGHTGTSRKDINDFYKGVNRVIRFGDYNKSAGYPTKPMDKIAANRVIDSFSKEKGTNGILFVSWGYTGGGHAMNYIVSPDGKLSIVDSQSGHIYKGSNLNRLLRTMASIDSYRTDNIVPDIQTLLDRKIVI